VAARQARVAHVALFRTTTAAHASGRGLPRKDSRHSIERRRPLGYKGSKQDIIDDAGSRIDGSFVDSLGRVHERPPLNAGSTVAPEFMTTRPIEEDTELVAEIGAGAFATIAEVRMRDSGEHVACKTLLKSENPTWEKECAMQSRVSHPLVCKLFRVHDADAATAHVLMDLCKGPDLFDYIVSQSWSTEMDYAG